MSTSNSEKIVIIEKHSLAIRWFHWVNFPLIMMMIWSGILIYWANRAYLPISDDISRKLEINNRLSEGLGWHFLLMWFFMINGFLYVLYLAITGEWRYLIPTKEDWGHALQVVLHDLKIRKSAPTIDGKFNGAQKVTYTLVLIFGFLALVTGFAIYKPVQLVWLTEGLGGYENARFQHFIVMCVFVLFFIVHLLQVIRAGWNNFRAMVTGYEIKKDSHGK